MLLCRPEQVWLPFHATNATCDSLKGQCYAKMNDVQLLDAARLLLLFSTEEGETSELFSARYKVLRDLQERIDCERMMRT